MDPFPPSPILSLLIPAAGEGRRFGASGGKSLFLLEGSPLLAHTLECFRGFPTICEGIVACPPGMRVPFESVLLRRGDLGFPVRILDGGESRQASIRLLALAASPFSTHFLIHDAARPMVPRSLLDRLIAGLAHFPAVIPALPMRDTLKSVNSEGVVEQTHPREKFRIIQTPQLIERGLYLRALERAEGNLERFTDDAGLVESIGGAVLTVPGAVENLKVTFPEDVALVEFFKSRRGY